MAIYKQDKSENELLQEIVTVLKSINSSIADVNKGLTAYIRPELKSINNELSGIKNAIISVKSKF
ncbi:MAG TPA: hypothetical protein VHP32_01615 [Ignavibacteria bacterium]|nr:hypothetical protein [Ignavibacteria bacterium]